MRKLLICLIAGSSLVAGGSALAGRPALAIVESEPLTVRGVNFSPYERVTVVVLTRSEASRTLRHSRTARTGVRGGFTLVLRGVTAGCGLLAVTATSESGKRALSPKIVPRCARP
ncbi:MAG: hypothetical protein ABR521_01795 [Gaiellaceae bacterium]